MTAKEYLGQAYWLDKRINSKLAMASSLRNMATRTSGMVQDEAVSHSRNVHSMEDIVSKLIDLEADINADIDRLIDLKREIIGVIHQVSNPSCQIILEYRYICYRPWKEIGAEMALQARQVYRLHERALRDVDGILKKLCLAVTISPRHCQSAVHVV